MKQKITLTLMLCGIMYLLGASRASAQSTTISVDYGFDSTWVNCPTPGNNIDFYMGGTATGYNNNTDSVHVYFNFGDGNDTSFYVMLSPNWQGFWANVTHAYAAPGIYSVQYIATGLDGNSDTLVVYNEVAVGTTCGDISGVVYHDQNNDCIMNASDPVVSSVPVNLLYNNQVIQTSWTDANGNYYFSAPGSFTYTVAIGNNFYGYTVSCPSSGTYSVSTLPSNNLDFGLTCQSGFDLNATISGWGFRPGFQANVYAMLNNYTCNSTSATATITLDPQLTFVSAVPAPSSVSGNVLTYSYPALSNSAGYQYINITVLTSLTANIGDTVCNTISVNPVTGDNNTANNTAVDCSPVTNSWDPNMKEVAAPGMNANGDIPPNPTLTYTVHFQNTGTDVAYNIYILDTLDADLDVNTLKVLGYSHNMSMNLLAGNVMKFNFNNIMLPDSNANEPASHGYVTYSVALKPALANGTQMHNTAHIYFDFNPAIVTNTTVNTIDIALGVEEADKNAISVAPNPASDKVRLRFTGAEHGSEVQLMDMLGNVIAGERIIADEMFMNVSSLPAGMYMIRVKSEKGDIKQRLVVVH